MSARYHHVGRRPARICFRICSLLLIGFTLAQPALPTAGAADTATFRRWIEEMKELPRGPFARIAWFCADGTVLPAKGSCSKHGGGIQHGEWSDHTKTIRNAGFKIANVLADLDGQDFAEPGADILLLQQILIERFLIKADAGWIFRAAFSYRGALQAEDEDAGSLRVLSTMLNDPEWRKDSRFFTLREAVRLLPFSADTETVAASDVRLLAKVIADKDPPFSPLRIKIHGLPDVSDAEKVREYARTRGKASLQEDYERLAADIETLYEPGNAAKAADVLASTLPRGKLRSEIEERADKLAAAKSPGSWLAHASYLGMLLRDNATTWQGTADSLDFFQTSLLLEDQVYAAGNALAAGIDTAPRSARLAALRYGARALYGGGLITKRHLRGIEESIDRLQRANSPKLKTYREELSYLARPPEWAGRTIVLHFSEGVDRYARIEPLSHLYPQDRLRGSPLLFYGAVVDSLVKDANALAGVQHELFGERIGAGLRALNPGLARGVLHIPRSASHTEDFSSDGIYLLPETISELPPVAGILTQGEGSSLSHVQLLARNLGIPNVVVTDALLPRVRAYEGQRVVLAVSPGGVVQLDRDGPRWDLVFGKEGAGEGLVIRPDLKKLDIDNANFISLTELRAKDSGRLAGPKSANLGELKHAFGPQVPPGFAIPFGSFRKLLDRPLTTGGPSVWNWMKDQYARIDGLRGATQERAVRDFLARLRSWIENVDPGPDFRARLRSSLDQVFQRPDGTYGVFVRSDTNVEDLPGFTGAGLNLTVPNVVGFDNILDAIRKVWASPFTERAYSWRQSHMEKPEYVFPAVLVQLAFPSEKSGVMVTADVAGGREDWLSVAVNEGVGGAVDGQAAESLLIHRSGKRVLFLAQATAPRRRELARSGGLVKVRASGTSAVLTPGEVKQLMQLADEAPKRFPSLKGKGGKAIPADIEFGFRNRQLTLLQIRPFVENKNAQRSQYLTELDSSFREREGDEVSLKGVPR